MILRSISWGLTVGSPMFKHSTIAFDCCCRFSQLLVGLKLLREPFDCQADGHNVHAGSQLAECGKGESSQSASEIQSEVTSEVTVTLGKIFPWFDHRFESSLEERADAAVSAIEPNAVADIEPLDGLGKVRFGCLEKQVVMVFHQDVSEEIDCKALAHAREQVDEMIPIAGVLEDEALLDAAAHDVICIGLHAGHHSERRPTGCTGSANMTPTAAPAPARQGGPAGMVSCVLKNP